MAGSLGEALFNRIVNRYDDDKLAEKELVQTEVARIRSENRSNDAQTILRISEAIETEKGKNGGGDPDVLRALRKLLDA